MKILEDTDESTLQFHPLTVVVAVNKSKNSRDAVKWALENFVLEERILFKLLHVRARTVTFPTPLGNYPISQVRDDIAAAYKEEVDRKTQNMLLPYKQMFIWKKVKVETLVIEADNVVEAISREVSKLRANKLVIGASSHSRFTWNLKIKDISTIISKQTPSSCTVYVIKEGKLSSVRQSNSHTDGSIKSERSDADTSTSSFSSYNSSPQIGGADQDLTASFSHLCGPSLATQHFQAPSRINQGHHKSRSLPFDICHFRSEDPCSSSSDGNSAGNRISSFRSLQMDLPSRDPRQAFKSDHRMIPSSEKIDLNFELKKLRIELRHARGIYAVVQDETNNASEQLNILRNRQREEALKFQEISLRAQQARELATQEKEKHGAAKREAAVLRDFTEREASERKEAENRAACVANENQMLEKALNSPYEPYKKFTWEEIASATSSFSDDLKIGMGAYGTVYKCTLNHVAAAVKVLHSKERQSTKEFQQELDILSKIRHPHLLLLLGACPDHSCLVYEYMENGSLDERLLQSNNTLPILWFDRFRIAWEVASALVFLHKSKPNPIIHRDLKPANILLDQNLVSKIGDVGLSKFLPSIGGSHSIMYKDSGLVGTLCYIDPEYQRSGIVSPKSDVYAFGMVILQLLTARPALALTDVVESALEENRLMEVLDPKAGSWPFEETKELAVLALKCSEIRRSDRPDLNSEVLPVLERLKDIASNTSNLAPFVHPAPLNDFICPLLKVVMEDPCVAADGYTYDRKAIEVWMKENDKSPVTSLPLSDKNLIRNKSLLSAITKWKS